MNEIICPNCKKAFKVDEAGFADILKQVRDQEFSKELNDRLATAEREKNTAQCHKGIALDKDITDYLLNKFLYQKNSC